MAASARAAQHWLGERRLTKWVPDPNATRSSHGRCAIPALPAFQAPVEKCCCCCCCWWWWAVVEQLVLACVWYPKVSGDCQCSIRSCYKL